MICGSIKKGSAMRISGCTLCSENKQQKTAPASMWAFRHSPDGEYCITVDIAESCLSSCQLAWTRLKLHIFNFWKWKTKYCSNTRELL